MSYSFCKLIVDEEYFDVIEIMSDFDCMCSIVTKIEMIGKNLSNGDYIIVAYSEEFEGIQFELVVIAEDNNIKFVEVEDYFN